MWEGIKHIRLPMGYPSVRRLLMSFLDEMISLWLIILLLLILSNLVSVPDWLQIFLYSIPIIQFAVEWLLPLACFVHLSEESICVTCFGIPVFSNPIAEVRLICGVGTESDQCLCLSRLSVEESTDLQETKLRKGIFTKGEVVFYKRAPDWKRRFARDYLNALRNKAYVYLRDKNQIWVNFDPNYVLAFQQLCGQASYCNLLDRSADRYLKERPHIIPTLRLQMHECTVSFHDDGIHVVRNKRVEWVLKANEIRTVARVHRFTADSKYTRNHTVFLVASTLTVSEMAAAELARIRGSKRDLMAFLSNREDLLAASFCLHEANNWTRKHYDLCPLYDTPDNAAAMQIMCSGAQWIDPFSGILD